MSNLVINCPHCDRPTPVELGKRVTTKQRCKHCGLVVGESDIIVGGRKPVVRKKVLVGGKEYGGEHALDGSDWQGDGAKPRRIRLSHAVIMVVLVVFGLCGVVYILYNRYEESKIAHRDRKNWLEEVTELVQKNDAKHFLPEQTRSTVVSVDSQQMALKNLRAIKECETPEQLLEYVRNPDAVREQLLEFYRQGRATLPIGESLVIGNEMRIDYDDSLKIMVFYAATQNGEPWWAVFEETESGPKLDWKSFVRYSDLEVTEFLATKPQEPKEFRVLAMIDDYFNYRYKAGYVCVALFDPEESFTFYGYAKSDSPLGGQIRREIPAKEVTIDSFSPTQGGAATTIDGVNPVELTAPGLAKPRALVTIKVKFPTPKPGEILGDNQVDITELVRRSWFIP